MGTSALLSTASPSIKTPSAPSLNRLRAYETSVRSPCDPWWSSERDSRASCRYTPHSRRAERAVVALRTDRLLDRTHSSLLKKVAALHNRPSQPAPPSSAAWSSSAARPRVLINPGPDEFAACQQRTIVSEQPSPSTIPPSLDSHQTTHEKPHATASSPNARCAYTQPRSARAFCSIWNQTYQPLRQHPPQAQN